MLGSMLSRVGRQIEHKFDGSHRELQRLQAKGQSQKRRIRTKSRKLLTPEALLAKLDRQLKAEEEPTAVLPRARTLEDPVFRRQSRQDLNRITPHKGDSAPPASYYTPIYTSVKPSTVVTAWPRTARETRRVSLDEGAMKLASTPAYPVRPTISFAKQLPRKASDPGPDHFLCTGSLTERVPGPDLAKTQGRIDHLTALQTSDPVYNLNFHQVWRPISRNFSFSKTSGRPNIKSRRRCPVYDHISYKLVEPNAPASSFRWRPARQDSALPLFMCGLTSWQSVSGINEKTLQLNGAVTERQIRTASGQRTARASLPASRRSARTLETVNLGL